MKFEPKNFEKLFPLPANEKWKEGVRFTEVFAKGNFKLEYFAPRGIDYQTPHEKDEIYIIVGGVAELIIEGSRFTCDPGDALFVSAGAPHHFEKMSDDFSAWAIFF